MYRIDILTLFDLTVGDVLSESILGRAQERDIIKIETHQIRDFTQNKQKQVDDYPYGGGHGAVMQADPLYQCWKHVCEVSGDPHPHTIYLSPCGKTFTQQEAKRLVRDHDHLVLVCGHYEGIDQRFIDGYVDEELSLGDFVLTGGEIPAMAVADAVCRMVPGVLPEAECYEEESHYNGLLEYPQYSRPAVWQGREVPEALLTGNHRQVARWRRKESLLRTRARRPDLFAAFSPQTKEDQDILREISRDDRRAAMTEPFTYRLAAPEDLPRIMEITHEAQARLKKRGVDQWQDGYPAEPNFLVDMDRGECYVLLYGDQIAAFFVLSGQEEATYAHLTDGYWGGEEPYAVLHRCAVAEEFLNLGVSDRMAEGAEEVARRLGRRWLRVDTHKKNRAMQALLRRRGFLYRGNVQVRVGEGHDPRRLAFDKEL